MACEPADHPEPQYLITRLELSRRLKQAPPTVYAAVAAGRVRTYGPRRMVDSRTAEREYWDSRDPRVPLSGLQAKRRRGKSVSPPPGANGDEGPARKITLVEARAKQVLYRAERERLDFEERARILVSRKEVEHVAYESARQARDLLLSLPDRLGSLLTADAASRLKEEIRYICEELSGANRDRPAGDEPGE